MLYLRSGSERLLSGEGPIFARLLAPVPNGEAPRPKWCSGPIAKAPPLEQSQSTVVNSKANTGSAVSGYGSEAVGYRVDEPQGCVGFVHGIPHGGRPPRPLVLVVSDRRTVRFISVRRIAAVLPLERRIVLHPQEATAVASVRRPAPARKAA